ncbi:MAG: GTPase Era [Clostridiales Family XIII bacterium]|jgi:GTP-binding protein Era|nr:GTPase Era [Clostridiales Family XIII bacterium]
MKSGFVAIIGRPNVGKSTLLNAIIGEKVAITADKPQTTRNRIRGIYTEHSADGDWQIVFLDTPGITTPRNKLGEYMARTALTTLGEVDAILFLTDEDRPRQAGDAFIYERLAQTDTPCILVLNKTDCMSPDAFKTCYDDWEGTGRFSAVFGAQALNGAGVPEILAALKRHIGEGPQYFPDDIATDHPERFLVTEIIREKLLHYLHEEVPHGIAVEIESYEEKPQLTEIGAVILAEKKSHKGIIIGKDGRKLQGVGKAAREEIEALLGTKVYLRLWVKVRENWRDSDFHLGSLGYRD